MFKVKLDDGLYKVSFHYGEDKKHRRFVDCLVYNEDQGYGWSATAVCSKDDQFVKATGRKNALAKALSELNRDVRVLFWNKYFEICKRG